MFGELRRDFQCWGESNEDEPERAVETAYRYCSAGDEIYVNSDFDTGQIEFLFSLRKSIKLNPVQFAKSLSFHHWGDNRSDFEHASNYRCSTDIVRPDGAGDEELVRLVSCVRSNKKLAGLYDTLLGITRFSALESRVYKLSLAGVERDLALAMHRRFLEETL